MLCKKTRQVKDMQQPTPGPCGGLPIWNLRPLRHWCALTPEDTALHILAGLPITVDWLTAGLYTSTRAKEDAAWLEGSLVLKRDGNYESVVLHSKCRWKKK